MLLQRVLIQYAGIVQASNQLDFGIVDVSGSDVACVTVRATEGTWGTAVFEVKHGENKWGPWASYSTPVVINTFGAVDSSGLIAVVGKYLVVEITTGEGAADYVDIEITHRKSEIATPVTI